MLSAHVRGPRLLPRWQRVAVAALLLVLAPALTSAVAGEPALAGPKVPEPAKLERVKLGKPKFKTTPGGHARVAQFDASARASLPAAQTVRVPLPAATAAPIAPARIRAGSSPITVGRGRNGGSPSQVRVTAAGQDAARAAGIHGVLFSVGTESGAGTVQVDVDPSTFANAYGGAYASRLRLVRLPACALTTPQVTGCRVQTPLATTATAPLSAQVNLTSTTGATILAATSGTSGGGGDYAATSLSPGGSWSTTGNTGAFTYQYPIAAPPPIGGLAPSLGLSYNSAAQDARTSGTNGQSSWAGDGWSMSDNFIERTYQSCSDAQDSGAPKNSGDLCWAGQILTLSLNGQSTPIVYHATAGAKGGTFRLQNDSSTMQIDNLFDATNGTKNKEYFRVTQNGTQYYFGLNRLPGFAAGNEETNSVQSVPVYQSHADVADCPAGSFADTACTLGYRFNLDYVVDLNGNAMAYYYNPPEMGFYGANMKDTAVSYVRASTIKRIDYGITASTIFSATAPEQVFFGTDERCIPGQPAGNTCAGGQFSVSNPEFWPDTPIDLNCTSGATCTNHAPSFWTRRMLTTITTRIQVAGAPKDVDRYDLVHVFPDNGDHSPTLWLQSITRTGLDRLGGATTDASAGTVSFDPIQYANRVGVQPGPKLIYNRIRTVWSETGAETTVDYDTPTCTGLPPANPSGDATADKAAQAFAAANTTGCFPVYWAADYQPEPLMDWFYTHPVRSVTTYDGAGNHMQDGTQPKVITQYAYQGVPGWHYDDDELVKKKNRTWGQFRGYPEVDITTGDPTVFHWTAGQQIFDQKSMSKSFYFRGMNGDTLPDGKTRPATSLNSTDNAVTVPDQDEFAGQVFETATYTSADTGAPIDSATVTVPTVIGTTASRTREGLPALNAYLTGTAKTLTRTKVSYGWRKTEADTFYNTALGQSTSGRPVQTADRGEVGAPGNTTTCTFNTYLTTNVTLPDGKTAPVLQPSEVLTTDQDCPATASPAGTIVSDTKTTFDTRGNPTKMQQASAVTGTTVKTWLTTATTAYDSYGRVTTVTRTPDSKMADGTTSLAQTIINKVSPTSGALPTTTTTITQVTPNVSCAAVTKSSKDCQLSTVTLDPARQQLIASTDVAGALTSVTYDALGRTSAVWLPNRSKAATAPANTLYSYKLTKTGPSVVTTKSLLDTDTITTNPVYGVAKTLYDAMLRPLETQQTGENGSTTVSDTQYDSHGWTVITNNAYVASGDPVDTVLSDQLSQVTIPSITVTDHDAMGRVTQSTAEHRLTELWHTRTAYTGDKTTVIPPTGAIATTTTTNVRDQLTEMVQHTTAPTLTGSLTAGFTATGGAGNSTTYGYDATGHQTTVTGPDKAVWTDSYDLLGRQTSHVDPDTGTSYSSYDDAGNTIATKDSRGALLKYTYDLLGRKLTAVDPAGGSFKFASWTYDTLRIGKPTSSTRYVFGVTGGYTVATTGYSVLGNPLGQTVTLPSVERPLPVSYTTKFTYSPNTELMSTQEDPAVGTLPGETITYHHDQLGAATKTSGIDLYVSGTVYNDHGQPSTVTMGDSTNSVQTSYGYDEATLRLQSRSISRTQAPGPLIDNTSYTYDNAGNPLSVVDGQSEAGSIVTDTQCYRYDALARLVDAWTAAGACPTAAVTKPATSQVATGSGAYWQSFGYNDIGNRTQSIDHAVTGGADATTTTYTNGSSTGTKPHTLTETTGAGDPTKFVYDSAGNLLTRTATSGNNQTLNWDPEGNLDQVTTTGAHAGTTRYLYDADGNQLIRRDPGRTSLFVGDTEVVINTAQTPVTLMGAVRTYVHGGSGAVAVRSTLPGGGTDYLLSDPHGTASLAIDTTTQAVSRQQYKPYGENRAAANTTLWPDLTHGYLGAPKDTGTGYTDLGARKYDPTVGRFISADPLLETTDPAQLGGYTYAGDNPMTFSDPSGLSGDTGNGSGNGVRFNPVTGGVIGGGTGNVNNGTDQSDGHTDNHSGGTTHKKKKKKKHSVTRFLTTVLEDTTNLANSVVGGPLSCLPGGVDACIDEAKAPLHLLSFAKDFAQCATNTGSGCEGINSDFDCTHGFTSECNAHLTVFIVSLVAGSAGGGAAAAEGAAGEAAAAEGAAAGRISIRCSFAAATPVLMTDGSTKPIEQVKPGDSVKSSDPADGEVVDKLVTAVHDDVDTDMADVTVADAQGHHSVLQTTQNHPFWDATTAQWTRADHLNEGDRLTSTKQDAKIHVVAVHTFTQPHHRYNLTVRGLHTYYVLAGKTPVLVHNCPAGGGGFLSRLFGGDKSGSSAVHEPNATVGDLRGIGHDNVDASGNRISDPAKESAMRSMTDKQLVRSTTQPAGGDMSLLRYHDEDNYLIEGNHRAAELIRRAGGGNYPGITDATPIYIHLWPGSG